MKTKIITLIALIAVSFAVNAQIDRRIQPKPGLEPKIKLGKTENFSLSNGLQVIMVENHKLPRVSVNLLIDNKPVSERNKVGLSNLMGSLLGSGTTHISKDEFNERVDYLGATISFRSNGVSAKSLKRYFSEVLGLMADGVKNAVFTQEEFDKQVKLTLDGLKANGNSVTSIARRVEKALTYGKKHPFGEFSVPKTIENITLADIKNKYATYYKPNNAYLVIVGDIKPSKTKKLVTKLFDDWKKGIIPTSTFAKPKNVATTEIDFINMPNAVQSEIAVTNNINLKLGDKDYYATLLANNILGGSGTARLFMNLREDKAYTYGAYSEIRPDRNAAIFKAEASVRNMVTDSSVVEIQKEINKIRYKKVSNEELKNSKAKYIGNFVMNVQKPETAAKFALNTAIYNLPKDFYENYLSNINAVTVDDIQNAAIKYFEGDKARIIVTGKGIDVLKNLEKTDYKINYFNKEGNPTQKPQMSAPILKGVTVKTVVDNYFNALGGKDKVATIKSVFIKANATIQGTPINLQIKSAYPNKSATTVSVMGNVAQKTVFNGVKGYQEAQGHRKNLTQKEIEEAKVKTAPFVDETYKNGKLKRIEKVDGKNAYVIVFNTTEIFYDVASKLKIKSVQTQKNPATGKEIKIIVEFKDYKELKGVKFPYKMIQSVGSIKMNFIIKEIKVNEGVSDKDFE